MVTQESLRISHKSPITEDDLSDLVDLYFNKIVTMKKKSLRIMVLLCSLQIQFCLQRKHKQIF